MRTPGLQDGVETHLEPAGNTGEFHRRSQVGAAQALSVQRVIAAFAGCSGFAKPHGLKTLAAVDELCAQDSPVAKGFAVALKCFIHDRETVTFAQCAVKIDVAGKHFGDLDGNRIGDACLVGGCKQRTLDGAASKPGRGRQGSRFQAGHKASWR